MGQLDSGNAAWILTSASLVFLMTPGVAFFYGGMVRAKAVLNMMIMEAAALSVTMIMWVLWGWSIAYAGTSVGGIFGDPATGFLLKDTMVSDKGVFTSAALNGNNYPVSVDVAFQSAFAMITVALICGAIAERVKYSTWMIFVALWITFDYAPLAHMVWNGGLLSADGAISQAIGAAAHDFAGGTVVHINAAVAALVIVLIIGKRKGFGTQPFRPHNVPFVMLGAFLLWFGWFGFNGGQTLSLTGEQTILKAASIFFTTNIAAAAGTTTAMVTTWIRYGKPDVSMTLDGSLAALVAITAGCDVVSVPGAFVIGALAGSVTVFLIEFIDQKMRIDDPVGAIAAHGGCGALGTLLTGLFSVQDGLFYTGEIRLFLVQLAGIVAMGLFVFVAMTLVFRILQATIGLRVSAAEEINGLDFKENGLVPAYELDRSDDLEDLSQALKAGEAPEEAQEIPLDQAIPDSVMASPQPVGGHALYNVTIITDEKRFETLKDAMEAIGITGMTITRALGFGIEKGRTEFYRGAKVSAKLLPKVRVEMVVSKVSPRTIIETAKKVLYTGNYGDGKVFVSAIDNAVKIRTGEEGYDALQDYPVVQKK